MSWQSTKQFKQATPKRVGPNCHRSNVPIPTLETNTCTHFNGKCSFHPVSGMRFKHIFAEFCNGKKHFYDILTAGPGLRQDGSRPKTDSSDQ